MGGAAALQLPLAEAQPLQGQSVPIVFEMVAIGEGRHDGATQREKSTFLVPR